MTRLDPDPNAPGSAGELDRADVAELQAALLAAGVATTPHLTRGELLAAWIAHRLAAGREVLAEGALELLPEGFGFVRSPRFGYEPGPHDPFVTPSQVRALNLKAGHWLAGPLRAPRGSERFFAMARIDRVNGAAPEQLARRVVFAARTPIVATRPLGFGAAEAALRVLARLAPWSLGQRVLVTAPPSWPRGAWLADVANALAAAAPALQPLVCLLDQRPEDLAAATAHAHARCEVTGTTFDQPPERHAALAEIVLARAMRDVEAGRDAVLLVDSLTALAHAAQRSVSPSGRWLCPGLDAQAVLPGKRLFAASPALRAALEPWERVSCGLHLTNLDGHGPHAL